MKVEKVQRNFWLTSEIECMLDLIKEMQSCQGTTATTHYTFVQIAAKMKKKGFPNKSPTQIRRKWFQMKSAYLCFKRGNVSRLLLIPERFRPVIAQFVDQEYQADNGLLESTHTTDELDIGPTIPTTTPTPTPTATAKTVGNSKGPSHKTKFSKFLSNLRQSHKLISKDFRTMQESLMMYEHKYQEARDANLITFINRFENVYQ